MMAMTWDRHGWDDEPYDDDAWNAELEQRYAEWLDKEVEAQREALMWRNEAPLVDGE